MVATKFYDTYTLYVKSGVAYQHQLIDSLRKAVFQASMILGEPLETKFKINLIMLKDNRAVGYGYIRVTNPKVYNILCGRNPDGSERYDELEDPDWIPPEETDLWADDEECPIIKIPQPPIVILSDYKLDAKQKLMLQDQIIETAKHDGKYIDKMNPFVGDTDKFEISRAFVYDVESNLCPNILCARRIPASINEIMLKNFFIGYTSDTKSKFSRKIGGKIIQDTYPFVTINAERIAFITFDPKTRDAQFALLMTKKIEVSDGDKPHTLIFTHSFKTK